MKQHQGQLALSSYEEAAGCTPALRNLQEQGVRVGIVFDEVRC
jgi:hypothetical protein